MKNEKAALLAAVLAASANFAGVQAAFDENLNNYTLDAVVVEADRTQTKFGDTITEQSYYRTGGDVKVITREEIEKRHYTDLTEAIKRIPGITFQNPGYRGGEYGYQFYNNGVSINGDTRVIVLVDGRRVDNSASSRISSRSTSGSKSTGVNLDQVTNIDNVEKIEVIKGPGASAYGPDATGGVINIITRKGAEEPVITMDLSTGSWDKHNYSLTASGSAGEDHSWRYFVSATRNMSGDTKYKDFFTGKDGTLGGSNWREQGVNVRIDKEFNDKQSLKIWYNFRSGKDGYPIAVPNLRYYNNDDWRDIIFKATVGSYDENHKLIMKEQMNREGKMELLPVKLGGDAKNPGYHNLYALDGKAYGSFSRFKNNDWDVTYTFNKVNGMESFVRAYYQNHRYMNRDKYKWSLTRDVYKEYNAAFPNGTTAEAFYKWIDENLAPWPGGDQDRLRAWVEKTGGRAEEPTSWNDEKNRGVQLQWADSFGQHDIIASVTYDKARNYSKRIDNETGKVISSHVQRNSVLAYVQDKIHLSDRFDVTPSLRYSKYSSFDEVNDKGELTKGKGSGHNYTPSLHMQYKFNDTTSGYFGWTRIARPLRKRDYTAVDGIFKTPLEDEKGAAWTMGLRKTFNDEKTTLAVHYDLTRMSNAIATLPILTAGGNIQSTAVNAKEDKKSFNITLDHKFNDNFMASASYSHMNDEWKAKEGWVLDPSWNYNDSSDINVAINHLRPKNHYSLNLTYEKGKVYTGLLINWYTGNSLKAFTKHRFLILDWNLNYDLNDHATMYVVVNNLTNEAYETSFNSWNGIGSSAMPGRSIIGGVRYKF